jgi:hypothetical protein
LAASDFHGPFGGRRIRFLADELGWNVPWWIYALIAVAIVAVLGYRQIDVSVKVLSVLVAAEFLVLLILGAVIVVKGGSFGTSGLSLEPLTPQRWFRGRYRSPCCSASPRSSDSKPPPSTARKPRTSAPSPAPRSWR